MAMVDVGKCYFVVTSQYACEVRAVNFGSLNILLRVLLQ